ncbi:Oligo-1,6-glucosidase 1 [Defluviimonas aquaemixtae]|uniref:Oligo-1,6-glucosidase 1 n=1 Tax=Albidovulum aquaemixtae TaxID=1542388 RepID=A0A2R8B5S3_9RHOB|nr:alpha-amylase family glycosyl hydrolase [Defluviimonas aquaemixtae]SPH17991.1 Oligo-1,6-glucosidase 1 [Defluviimonas aquaemixtae]
MTVASQTKPRQRQLAGDRDWWKGAVIYQIYPRSFQDSNGDGIGDLPGITRRLDHVAGLGADAIWISPFFTSPMKDYGYDVSDYREVDPMFGTLADFDALVARAHELGLRVMIDLVLSHTSDQHPWFLKSRADRTNPRADWYVWSDAKPDGTPPNNWLAIFGGPAWHWEPRRMQYYLHNFLTSQPDLNFQNTDVQEALLDVARFWLDRGVDGFRLDTINFYFADKELRDNPALLPQLRNDSIAPLVNPYNWQEHVYSKNRPENLEFLRKIRSVMDEYGAAALGEVGDAQRGLEIMAQYTSGDDLMQMCYAFEFLSKAPLTAVRVAETFGRLADAAPDAWPCWAFSNHDVVRHASRWRLSGDAIKTYATLLMCLKGSACLYQGEELGLPEAEIAFEDLHDPYGKEFWPEFKGRDGCRTPMVWEAEAPNGGFSAAKPWLPVPPEHLARSASVQRDDPEGLPAHYRRAIALRHAHPALARGAQDEITAEGDVIRFIRRHGDEEIFVAVNLSDRPATIAGPGAGRQSIGDELGAAVPDADGAVALGPWGCALLRRGG